MPPEDPRSYIDLSWPIETGMTTFPGDPEVTVSRVSTVESDGFAVHSLCCGTHTGTHIDAPSHVVPAGQDVTDRPVSDYVFETQLVDVTPCSPREAIGPEQLPDRIDDTVDLIVCRTGWDTRWDTPEYVDHPYLTADAARLLRAAGCGLGVDTLNPDPTPQGDDPSATDGTEADRFPVHHTLLGAELPIIENLTGLDALPERWTFYAFPLPIVGGDGAPIRAVAAVPSETTS
ncbi:cyclase family protein [Halorubrum vacuolatum]|uniref:Kynurenine formamidase n=1 Tax=Halorubrum vacuolatum TaxID=63740 RepID=A0A238VCX7_HALVU|nr:cyclase family protein [Halorubrum vacuolatum]SNR31543.1 Kynurenine formamidase [Halorubrum vacuolatum]